MTEGIVWLALLGVFVGLARLGWLEYRKVEAYGQWAQQFERAKYDIYGVLGQAGQTLTWGVPTRHGPTDLGSCAFADLRGVSLCVDNQWVDWQHPPPKGRKIALELQFITGREPVRLRFTQMTLAVEWVQYLQKAMQAGADVAKD